ncbi:MAG TPA: LCP family protein [Stackebrandtia sp.]|uniref:LCP family protein n=1 Tax=Stackebrandtia sp. TaxID=2023065 RepID=UPI002D49797C|nr:LCP family protein [Stackebrandtia sp.]HZE39777.1 LCP family protein [Stackebrandtia sp.]
MANRTGAYGAKATRRKAPLWAKFMVVFGSLLVVAAGGAVAFGANLINDINGINQKDMGVSNADEVKGPLNLLMVGADLRVHSSQAARADTIMIMHINKSLTKATIVSIPRDLRTQIRDCGNGLTCTDKINASYPFGGKKPEDGAKNLADTVSDLTATKDANGKPQKDGIDFNGIALVNFEGFLDVVKEFGGIDLCLSKDLHTLHGGDYKAGCRRYKPADALAIVRERHNWPDGDYGRQRMQQQFIKQLLKEADSQGYVKNPTRVGGLIKKIGDQLILDLGGIKPVDYALALRGVKAGSMQTIKLPSEPQNIDGTSYVVIQPGPEQDAADALFKALKDDTLDAWVKQNPDYLNKDPSK